MNSISLSREKSLLKMSLQAQRNRLRTFVQSMYDEGLINDDYYQVQELKDTVKRDYVVRTITSFCMSAESLLTQLSLLTNQVLEVNYLQINASTWELHTIASSVGAERVKVSCVELARGCEQNNKDYCLQALYWAKTEYSKLRRNFETVVKMERKIIDLENGL